MIGAARFPGKRHSRNEAISMSDKPDGLTPEQLAELEAHWNQQEHAKEEAKRLTWTSFLDWLKQQTDLLRKNPGLFEQISQVGPALLTQLLRLIA
jgi:hypothetical protein